MKKTALAAFAALIIHAAPSLHAQSFTAAAGFSSAELFNLGTGYTISALGADTAGNLFYFASGNFGGGPETRLFERTSASGFATAVDLFSYGSQVSGSFVKVNAGTVYFGENSTGTIRSISAGGGAATLLGTVTGNYDAAFRGSDLFLSANPASNDNKVYRFLPGGQLDTVLDTGGDFSGPITFDSAGNLLYGATNFASVNGGIYSFSAAQVSAALDANPSAHDGSFNLSSGTQLFANGSNQYLAAENGTKFFQGNSPFGSAAFVKELDAAQPGAPGRSVGQTGTGEFFGGMASANGALYVAVTSDFSQGPSAVFKVVPEPGSMALLAGAGALLICALRRRGAV